MDGPSSYRSETLAARDAVTRATIAELGAGAGTGTSATGAGSGSDAADRSDAQGASEVDLEAATALWDKALRPRNGRARPAMASTARRVIGELLAEGAVRG
ncbi:hypothetical protein [Streptomyces sp. NPDC054961]